MPPNGADYIQRFWADSAVDFATANLSALGTQSLVIADANTASQRWDNVTSNPNWGYFKNSNESHTNLYWTTPAMCANTAPLNKHDVWVGHLWQASIPSGASMAAKRCTLTNGRITRAYVGAVLFPSEATQEWHFGNTKPPGVAYPNAKRSFVGTLTHEFGHVVGFGAKATYIHFPVTNPANVACDNGPSIASGATMCDVGPPPVTHDGISVPYRHTISTPSATPTTPSRPDGPCGRYVGPPRSEDELGSSALAGIAYEWVQPAAE